MLLSKSDASDTGVKMDNRLTIRLAFGTAFPWVVCAGGEPVCYCATYGRAAGLLS